MTRKTGDLANAKLRMLEILINRPEISTAELSRTVGINEHTGKKYRVEIEEMIVRMKASVERKLEERIEATGGIWQKVKRLIK